MEPKQTKFTGLELKNMQKDMIQAEQLFRKHLNNFGYTYTRFKDHRIVIEVSSGKTRNVLFCDFTTDEVSTKQLLARMFPDNPDFWNGYETDT